MLAKKDIIAAVATPPGKGGVGIVRVTGISLDGFCKKLLGRIPSPRIATHARFSDAHGAALDDGLAIFFPAPRSFTGQDVLELQGHGGIAVTQAVLARCAELGARLAEPGEFTQRAFLNGKLDLAQAEAVADLIDASSGEAVRAAARSLTGEFSQRVHALRDRLIELRMHVEACIDFPDEEIDPADRGQQQQLLAETRAKLARVTAASREGAVLRDGLTVVLIGPPNVGKSSLLNRLAGDEVAIVSPIAGTTRDQVRSTIHIDGLPLHLIDTAGLRETTDPIERIGIERTWAAIERAGAALVIQSSNPEERLGDVERDIIAHLPAGQPRLALTNKSDLLGGAPSENAATDGGALLVSAKTGAGIDALRAWLKHTAGLQSAGEGLYMARARHLVALQTATTVLDRAAALAGQWELFAEELRIAQTALSQITGEFTADDLLGEIFSRFCIGK